jgi:RimJ/RimL family protein N-acetyltransferase
MTGLAGRWTRCRPVTSDDLPFVYTLLTDPRTAGRFRWRGQTPSLDEFAQRSRDGVLAQWIVEWDKRSGPLGLVMITEPDFVNSTGFISILADPVARDFGVVLDGAAAVIDHVFDSWPFRYLYADVAEEALPQFSSGEGWVFTHDGFRRKALFLSGRYQDVHHLSISAESWKERVRPAIGLADQGDRGPAGL